MIGKDRVERGTRGLRKALVGFLCSHFFHRIDNISSDLRSGTFPIEPPAS